MSKKCHQCGLVNWEHDESCKRCNAPLNVAKPPVHTWFVVYCILMALLYLSLIPIGIMFLFIEPDRDLSEIEARVMGTVFITLGSVLSIPFAAAPFLPRKSWVWVLGLVLICIGLTSACCLPVCVPLLIYWIKPEMKIFYGRLPDTLPPPPPQWS